jgi:hypothetical protein
MLSSGMLRREALVRTDGSDERVASIIRVFQLLVTLNVVPSSPILVTPMMEGIRSSEASVLTRATGPNIQKMIFFYLLHFDYSKSITFQICTVCYVLTNKLNYCSSLQGFRR